MTKQIRKSFDEVRNNFYKPEAEKLDEAYEGRNLERLFRIGRNSTSNKKPVAENCPGLEEHFKDHFSHPTPKAGIIEIL